MQWRTCLLALALPGMVLLAPRTAAACGGTFCDGAGPVPMPVDQTGEDILFVRDGDQIEAHVRIEYTGEAERFAWMIPLPAVPEVSLGCDELFSRLSGATIPFWNTQRTFADPSDQPGLTSQGFVPDDGGGDPSGPPTVVSKQLVGDFEVVVLQGGTASEVIDFFIANDYAFEDDAEPLLQEYIDEGFLITGVKLQAGADVEAIQPLVFRFTGFEPCVPLRLTSVAVRDDMGIRAYFLGDERWAPSNYQHVLVNPFAFDWNALTYPTYVAAVSQAVDEAGGQAFVTEYAGPTSVVPTDSIWRPEWTTEGMVGMTELELIHTLSEFGLLPSAGMRSEVWAVMREYLPPPAGWLSDEVTFWYWLRVHDDVGPLQVLLDPFGNPLGPLNWDIPGFAAAFDERIIIPGAHAVELLTTRSMLTRLHTTMSGHEMTLDPIFHPAPELGQLRELRQTGALVLPGLSWTDYAVPLEISGITPDVRSTAHLCVVDDGPWPFDSPAIADMPRALRVEQLAEGAPPQVLVDNEAAIRAALNGHNAGSPCELDESGTSTGTGTSESGSGSDGAGLQSETASCACDARNGAPLGAGASLVLLGLLGVGGRRRDTLRSRD
jgi:hypothetical protein